ncbi:MAG: septum formation protein Maf [Bacteroidia bacterium]|nr:septum formation protein Maf [Bacteroidia bacterium]
MHKLILASSSPRRQYLLKAIGLTFDVVKPDVDEDFPATMQPEEVASYLAEKKASYFDKSMSDHVVIAADTVVILGREILNKPADRAEAIDMLTRLAGNTHTVITGVCIAGRNGKEVFHDRTLVTFHPLAQKDIEFYVDHFSPFDKAGSYGAQDCLPPDVNPCSAEEIRFLTHLGKLQLIESSKTTHAQVGLHAIRRIDGSYFNVMGIPIHRVYERLMSLS